MRGGEEEYFNASALEQIPGEGLELEAGGEAAAQLGMDFGKRNAAARFIFGVDATGKDWGRALETGMVQQQAGQFCAGVACYSYHCGLYGVAHDSRIVLSRASTSTARRASGQMTNTVSSPAMVPTTSGQLARSSAAATGCAPPMVVRTTT